MRGYLYPFSTIIYIHHQPPTTSPDRHLQLCRSQSRPVTRSTTWFYELDPCSIHLSLPNHFLFLWFPLKGFLFKTIIFPRIIRWTFNVFDFFEEIIMEEDEETIWLWCILRDCNKFFVVFLSIYVFPFLFIIGISFNFISLLYYGSFVCGVLFFFFSWSVW